MRHGHAEVKPSTTMVDVEVWMIEFIGLPDPDADYITQVNLIASIKYRSHTLRLQHFESDRQCVGKHR